MADKDPFIGKKIGQIELTSKVGQGGMGAVYKGRHAFLGKDVAVKFLSKALVENKEFIDRFIREAQTLARVEHKNLVRVYDAGEWEGNYYIVMEFIQGKSLGDILKNTARIPVEEAANIIKECAEGLNAAATQSIIHRDIKPDNIMILDDGGVKVTDFGLAKSLESEMEITQTGQLMGTPHYMSPEQCDGEHVDFRADMYSLGATFYRIITGAFPFTGNTPFAVMRKHVQEPLTPASTVLKDIPREVSDIIEKTMAKKPIDRYASYQEFINALEKFTAGGGTGVDLAATVKEMKAPDFSNGPPPGMAGTPTDMGTAPTMVPTDTPASQQLSGEGMGTSPTIVQGGKKSLTGPLIIAAVVLLVGAGVIIALVAGGGDDTPGDNPPVTENPDPVPVPDKPEPIEPAVDKALQIYEKALLKYNSGETAAALTLFKRIISDYPVSEYADKALEYTVEIEKRQREIREGIQKVQKLLAGFEIEEAELVFTGLNLDVSKEPRWQELESDIARLKAPVAEIKTGIAVGRQFIQDGAYQEAADALEAVRGTSVEIGCDTQIIDDLLTSARQGLEGREFAAAESNVRNLLKECRIADAEKEIARIKDKFGSRAELKALATNLKELQVEIRAIKSMRIKGMEQISRDQFQEALETLEAAKAKSAEINYTEYSFDEQISTAREGVSRLNKYKKMFADAEAAEKGGAYPQALTLTKQTLAIRNTPEARKLLKDIESKINTMRDQFQKDQNAVKAYIEKSELTKAEKVLESMMENVLDENDQTYIDSTRKRINQLRIASTEADARAAAAAEAARLAQAQAEKDAKAAASREAAEAEAARKNGAPAPRITDTVRNAVMVLIPGGTSKIGTDTGPRICRPSHAVTIDPFYMDIKEVTNREFELFKPTHRAKRLEQAAGDDMPVTNITWKEAAAYCAWLSKKEGRTYRLPTEAEWEIAARGGKDNLYSSGKTFKGAVNVSSDKPVAATTFAPNPYGLYNMSGNVWEFCSDWIGAYNPADNKNPHNDDPGKYKARVVRGGSFSSKKPEITASTYVRNGLPEDKYFRDTGFRCVRELP